MLRSAPAVAMCDEDGILTFSSPAHSELHSRPVDELVGRDWRTWAPVGDVGYFQDMFLKTLSGTPVSHLKAIVRPDGTSAYAHMQMFPSKIGRRTLVIGSFRTIPSDRMPLNYPALSVAEYVSEMAAELSTMASRQGLSKISDDLDKVAALAGDLASLMQARLPILH